MTGKRGWGLLPPVYRGIVTVITVVTITGCTGWVRCTPGVIYPKGHGCTYNNPGEISPNGFSGVGR